MAKLSEIRQKPELKLLVYGDAGGGKTIFATSFPVPMTVLDFDGKADSAALFYAKDQARLEGVDVLRYLPTQGEAPGHNFLLFYNQLVQWEQQVVAGQFQQRTVVLDSLTTFYDAMMAYVMAQNKQNQGKRIQIGPTLVPLLSDYSAIQQHFKTILMRLLALPCHVLLTAHISADKDELTGEIVRQVSISGKQLAPWLPVIFKECWRVYAEQAQGGVMVIKAQTKPDVRFQKIRSQITGLPATLDVTRGASVLEAYLGAAL